MSGNSALTIDNHPPGWHATRTRLTNYFDRTAFDAWAAMTSDAPVSRIRATVRAGREEMRNTLLSWLPSAPPSVTGQATT